MKKNLDERAKGLDRDTARRHALREFRIGLAGVALVCGGAKIAWADWTPPESSVTPPAVLTLDAFAVPTVNGTNPCAPLVVGPDGALYGLTQGGGAYGDGTIFRLESNGTFSKLHDFSIYNYYPYPALVAGPDGALYGTTAFGGANAYDGTVFRLKTDGTYTTIHNFNGNDGSVPLAGLTVGPDGQLYGTTSFGGFGGNGSLFRLQTNGGGFSNLRVPGYG
jgi:uncharacterized repeat protein (TIGR03803 family)